jgi:hypothetical protein
MKTLYSLVIISLKAWTTINNFTVIHPGIPAGPGFSNDHF